MMSICPSCSMVYNPDVVGNKECKICCTFVQEEYELQHMLGREGVSRVKLLTDLYMLKTVQGICQARGLKPRDPAVPFQVLARTSKRAPRKSKG